MFTWRTRWQILLLTCIVLYFCLPVYAAVQAHPAGDPITVTAQTEKIDFPNAIDFQISAHDGSSAITRATIVAKYNWMNKDDTHIVNAAPSAADVTLNWHDNLMQGNFTPVGTKITYSWIIEDSAGNTYSSAPKYLQVTDTRFTWQHLTEGKVQVNWYNRSNDFGQGLLTQVEINVKHVSSTIGLNLNRPINVWVYASITDFKNALPPDVHEWVGGIAFIGLDQASIVVEDLNSEHLHRDMPHELTHLIFHQSVTLKVPLWFDEGLAVYNQFFHESNMTQTFNDAVAQNGLLSLNTITDDFPNDANQANLAYAESWNFMAYLYNTYGQTKMNRLIQNMHDSGYGTGDQFNTDVQETLGSSTERLENNWHVSLGLAPTMTQDQLNPKLDLTPHPIPTIQTTDNTEPLFVWLGILLILVPTIGFTGLYVQQRRTRYRVNYNTLPQGTTGTFIAGDINNFDYNPYGYPDYTKPSTYNNRDNNPAQKDGY